MALQVATGHVAIACIPVQGHGDQIVVCVVADEVYDNDALFMIVKPQSSSQLLGKDYAGLGVAEHDYLVERRNIDAFVKQINGEDVVQVSVFQVMDSFLALRNRGIPGDCLGTIVSLSLLISLTVEQL